MINKIIFRLGYSLKRPMVLKYYKEFVLNNSKSIDELEHQQNESLKCLLDFCLGHVPYYQRLLKSLCLTKADFKTIKDLEKLPILTKDQIKGKWKDFIPANTKTNFTNEWTGGSTGEPLKFRMSKECYERGVALLLKGWGFGGYKLGDRLSVIAGASLVSNTETFKKKAQDLVMNLRHYSSYGMDSQILNEYLLHMNKWKPVFIRGYASSLYILAKHVDENSSKLTFPLKGIFSTAESLTTRQRELIEKVFRVKVYDNYGLNDGGVSAYECHEHNGMHVDYERSILQTVDDSGVVITGKIGKIIATSLYNFAMPFLRYDTGDLGIIDDTNPCPCGNKRPLLKKVYGRTTDYLKLNNKIIGSPILTVLMGKVDLEHYQIIQKDFNEIDIKYIKNSSLDGNDEDFIKKSFFEHVGQIIINFNKIDPVDLLAENKHRFIINEVCK